MSQVMVLAAGRGRRLGELTDEVPKPLVPVGDRPMLRHLCDRFVAQGQLHVVINTHHLAECFERFEPGAARLTQVFEPKLRGTAGGVYGARRHLTPPVVVYNGDIWADVPLAELLEAGAQHPLCLLVAATKGEGTVGLDDRRRVVRLRGQRFGAEAGSADYVGVAALGSEALSQLPPFGCLVADLFLPWLRSGRVIKTICLDAPWTDLGRVRPYIDLNVSWLKQRQLDRFVATGAVVGPEIGVEQSVVGEGAQIEGAGRVSRCVVWPGARLKAPARDVVVTSSGRIVGSVAVEG